MKEKREIGKIHKQKERKWNGTQTKTTKKTHQKRTQTKKKDPIRCKSAKCYNERYIYKKTEYLEQYDSLHYSQHGKEKVEEQKERNYRAIFRKKEHRCWNNRWEDTCENVNRVVNEDTSGNPVYVDENRIIYNSI